MVNEKPCHWKIDDVGGDSVWETTCGQSFYFDGDGGPLSHGLRWCGFCGKPLVELFTSGDVAQSDSTGNA
jgi:hypothetical protein